MKVLIVSFDDAVKLNKLKNIEVDIDSLAEFGEEHGMAFDEDDIEYYTLFKDKLNRNLPVVNYMTCHKEIVNTVVIGFLMENLPLMVLKWKNHLSNI